MFKTPKLNIQKVTPKKLNSVKQRRSSNPVENIFDHEHEEIKKRHQALRDGIIGGIGMDGIIARSKELIQVTLKHFKSEEAAMIEFGSQFDAHRRMHAEMVEILEEISFDLEQRRINGAMELMKFVDGRLSKHLEVEDVVLERELLR